MVSSRRQGFTTLVTSDYAAVDFVSPFFGVLVERCCGFLKSADITAIFSEYLDLANFMFRKNMTPE